MGFGMAFGGAAKGIATGLELGQRNRALDLESRALDIREKQDGASILNQLRSQADSTIGEGLKTIGEIIKEGQAAGLPPDKIAAAIEEPLGEIESLAGSVGKDMSGIRASIQARLQIPSPPKEEKIGSTLESIKAEIAAHPKGIDGLSPGKRRLYEDAIRMDAFDRAMLKASEGGGSPETSMPDRIGGGAGMIPPSAIRFLKANSGDPAVLQAFRDKYGVDPKVYLGG